YGQTTVIGPNRPSCNPLDAAFQPPAVQYTQRRYPVECSFHPAGAGGFERWLRGVEPDIDTSGEQGPQGEIIIGQVGDLDVLFEDISDCKNVLDQLLPLLVVGVRFPRIDHLQPTDMRGQLLQPLDVLEQQVDAFVGRGPSGKPQR